MHGTAGKWVAATVLLSLGMAAQARPVRDPAAALAGRVAGKPVSCIQASRADQDTQTFDTHEILFRGGGGTWYLNRLANCPQLTSTRGYTVAAHSGEMCAGDLITVIDPPAPIDFGACPLGEFVPYTRAKTPRQ